MLANKRQTGNKLSNKTNSSTQQLKQLKFINIMAAMFNCSYHILSLIIDIIKYLKQLPSYLSPLIAKPIFNHKRLQK